MRPSLALLTCATVLAAAVGMAGAATTALAAPKIGEPAPDFTAVDSKGQTVKLADYRGKTVILEWTNEGCPYVKKHYGTGNMQALQKETTGGGVVWLTVISSAPGQQGHLSPAEIEALATKQAAAPTATLIDADGKIGKAYDAKTTPHMYVIKPDGVLAYAGAIDDKPTADEADVKTATNYVKNALAQIAAGKPVDPALTRAYGCSVKYGS
ncbi:MAG: thioredoxin family protein [Hyphomicrobiaceae bacterium]|nr:thioredoxin family protein [Hyphomicrobiaceae bacterium]